ncbi:DUF4091 domain-containing protein [Cohnella pontilimi]|uniref:DUF4091 domain-containing protein n=1 Tax=Cohnella pontilimi TaxID=2564100 RepID=A0A4U0FGQ5_9BACL|nr:DUF4091 domain-containing protein [Cohnella pontilimi]TJY44125.1 DUF4091 domain-containing protein [Cohnella pontilimi]
MQLQSTIAGIWAVNDGEKIRREDTGNPNKIGNSVWDGQRIRIFGGRNETIAFQLIVAAGASGIRQLQVDMSGLTNRGSSSARIVNEEPYPDDPNHYVGRRIEVFAEHYLFVPPELSTKPQWFYAPSAPPLARSGWIPDALIPHRIGRKGGIPDMNVLPGMNQGFWVDLYIPDDGSLPPGYYDGYITVSAEGEQAAQIPVELLLYDFTLPHENHSTSMVYAADYASYFPGLDNCDDALRKMAHRHRFDLVGFPIHTKPFDKEHLERNKPYLNGDFYSRDNGYEGPGIGQGDRVFPIGMYGARVLGNDPAQMQAEADKWVDWFEQSAWNGRYFLYLIDEPRASKFDWINEQVAIIKGSAGAGRRLPFFTTRTYTAEIEHAIDIWCAGMFNREEKSKCDETGKQMWFYNGYRPSHGSVILEGDAVDMRVNAWIQWQHRIDLYFLWHATHWQHNSQGPRGRWHQNVFAYPVTFMHVSDREDPFYGDHGVHWGNGDGILFYPGREPYFREQDRGIDGPISSIRMKNMRRGIQDYEYLWLLSQGGRTSEADAVARQAIPKSLHEVSMEEQVSWSTNGSDWDAYRKTLAVSLAQ